MKNDRTDWSTAKNKFQQMWNKLKPDELEKTSGDKEALAELLKYNYGMPHAEAMSEVSEIMDDVEVRPELPESEEGRTIDDKEKPVYPNKLYEEELPPDTQLEE